LLTQFFVIFKIEDSIILKDVGEKLYDFLGNQKDNNYRWGLAGLKMLKLLDFHWNFNPKFVVYKFRNIYNFVYRQNKREKIN
jgi:hypothetical protein